MIEVRLTDNFIKWRDSLRDSKALAVIARRLVRLRDGNPGDVKPVGDGVSELRINYGPGYRIYFIRRGAVLIVLLCGGDKSTQSRDITRARELAERWADDDEEDKS